MVQFQQRSRARVVVVNKENGHTGRCDNMKALRIKTRSLQSKQKERKMTGPYRRVSHNLIINPVQVAVNMEDGHIDSWSLIKVNPHFEEKQLGNHRRANRWQTYSKKKKNRKRQLPSFFLDSHRTCYWSFRQGRHHLSEQVEPEINLNDDRERERERSFHSFFTATPLCWRIEIRRGHKKAGFPPTLGHTERTSTNNAVVVTVKQDRSDTWLDLHTTPVSAFYEPPLVAAARAPFLIGRG